MIRDLFTLSLSELYNKYIAFIIAFVIIFVIIYFISRAFYYMIFKKANKNAITAIIPIYNMWELIKIADLSAWYMFLLFIPFANLIAIIKIKYEIAIRFGKDVKFTYLYLFIPIIALYILAFRCNYIDFKAIEEAEANNPILGTIDNFVPVQNENAVPYDEGVVAYEGVTPVDTNVQIERVELELPKSEEMVEVVEKTTDPVFAPVAPAVPMEEGAKAYVEPEKELTTVYEEKSSTFASSYDELPEAETIVMPTVNKQEDVPGGIDVLGLGNFPTPSTNQQVKYCSNCGTKMDTSAVFCFNCGTKC